MGLLVHFLYAGDVLLAPSAQTLQSLVNICELELKLLDMAITASKSVCIHGSMYTKVLVLM